MLPALPSNTASAISHALYATPALVFGRAAVTPIFETTPSVTISNPLSTAIKTPVFTTTTSQDDTQVHVSPIFKTSPGSSAVIDTDPVTATPIFDTTSPSSASAVINTDPVTATPIFDTTSPSSVAINTDPVTATPIFDTTSPSSVAINTDPATSTPIFLTTSPKESPTITTAMTPSSLDLDSISFVLATPTDPSTTSKPTGASGATTSNDISVASVVLKTTTKHPTPTTILASTLIPTTTHSSSSDHTSSTPIHSAGSDTAGNPINNTVVDNQRALIPIMATTVGSAGLYGLYCSLFAFAMFVSLSNAREARRPTYYLQWTASLTFVLITVHFLLELAFNWPTGALLPDSFYYHVAVMHLILPLCVALLSDGILAWRVYVVWDRKEWIKWTLIGALGFNFLLGLIGAAKLFIPFFKGPAYAGYGKEIFDANTILIVWAWFTFIGNSTLSAAMLLRIFGIGSRSGQSFGQNGRARYVTIISSIVQSALISWFGILSCAISWSVKTRVQSPVLDAITELKDTDTHTVNYAVFVLVTLPFLLGISQVLLIARTGITRFQHPEHLAKNLSMLTHNSDTQDTAPLYREKLVDDESAPLTARDSTMVRSDHRTQSNTFSSVKSPAKSYYESGYHDADLDHEH